MKGLSSRWLWLLLLALIVVPFVGPWSDGAEFIGTDSIAQIHIENSNPDYQPWFSSVFQAIGEVESFLFAAQAAIGAGALGYFIGLVRGRAPHPWEVKSAKRS